MKRFLLFLILVTLAYGGFAQHKGTLHVQQDGRIEQLKKKQREVYAANNTMNGFRVQIFMESGNMAVDHAQSTKASFEKAFPELPVYLSYEQPYYRLRVGDFRSRIEAEKYLRILKSQYNMAFVTADIINPPARIKPMKLEEQDYSGEDTGEDLQESR